MQNISFLPICAALLLALALVSFGSAWIDTLYAGSRGILSFPEEAERRARHRRLWLSLLGAACGFHLAGFLQGEALFWGFLALFFLLLITCTDFEQYVIFDAMLLPFALAGLAATLLLGMPVPDHLLSGFLGGLAFLLLAILTRGGIGGGDVKLIAVLGLWFGSERLPSIVVLGLLLGGLAALFLLLSKKKKRQEAFAYGPYFCLAAIFFLLTEGM